MGQFDWLNMRQGGISGSILQHANCSIHTCKLRFEVSNSAGIVRVIILRFVSFGTKIDQ
jgi:hypothetical protein